MFRFLTTLLLTVVPALLWGQADTVYFNEVKIWGVPLGKYTTGSKTQLIRHDEGTTLADVLINESPLYFKTYGNGQLSTVSFRGTSASHTAVMWNGINVNSPTLGQSDFSLWPSFLLEDISLQYGAGSALYGTDAVGGSVLLSQTSPQFSSYKKIEVRQEAGSFGHWLSGVKVAFGSKRLEYKAKVFYRSLENNFKYTSPKIGFEKKQTNAAVTNYGFDQQMNWKISESKRLSVQGQYVYNFREVQPTVTSNDGDEVLKDGNTRVAVSYHQDTKRGFLFATLGYIINDQLYDRRSTTRSDQLNTLFQYDFSIGSATNVKAGANWTKYFVKSNGFDGHLTEDRYDGFLSLRQRVSSAWLFSFNLRQSIYADRYAPLAPSLGSEFALFNSNKSKITLRVQLARAYRIPTFNDRYWNPGGNPDLKSESGYHAEVGGEFIHKNEHNEFRFELTHYRSWIDQWIIWLPNSATIWSPFNLSKVNTNGIEAGLNHTLSRPNYKIRSGINYALTNSINKKGLNASDVKTIGKQLPYVPVHSGHTFIRYERKSWSSDVQLNYTGKRYTTLDNEDYQALKAYALVSASISKRFVWSSYEASVRLSGNNLFNIYYENVENMAMPGRNYLITLNVKI